MYPLFEAVGNPSLSHAFVGVLYQDTFHTFQHCKPECIILLLLKKDLGALD